MTTPKNELLFLALGGSNEIGMNVNLYGCQGKWVMVDLGLTFANAEYPGIDLILPDLEFIEQRKDDLLGIVLTHGHEDHIGAVAYFAADLGVPLYATPFTATLIRGKLEEEGILDSVELNIIPMEGSFALGPFGFQLVTLAHSILEMSACVISTPYGKIFHSGDWKLDEQPVIGKPSTAEQLSAIGDEGILALICDSTNAFNAGDSGSEGSVKADLLKSVKAAKGRVLLTTFASNAARLQTMGEVARETGRTLCFAGRSLHRIIEAAQANGYLKDLPKTVDMESVDGLARKEVMVVATGGQGEARAALARIAEGNHPVKLEEGDTVIFSSKQIPGNEIAIGVIMNKLAERNILTVTEKQAHVHVSGHPGQPELAKLYDWIKPELLVPVHGERRHMAEQARFAMAHGVKNALVQSNGDVVRLAPGKPEIIGKERTGRLILDGDTIISADGSTINERRKLSWYGLISVAFALDSRDKISGSPQIRLHGIPIEEDLEDFLDDVTAAVNKTVRENKGDFEKLRESTRLAVRRVATSWTGKKPIVDVMILETA
ncbi:ribonuclease J [Sphingorhabdus sp. IMCC26285]|jgi:ribonuclease J|uniref:Ribonuclease J n=1 Tax=Sphingorhabdus profundilacus TaxID=2509718 RepID=A0A6I4LY61_9SPHN|nr:ribonuclease J [Sphingorhabdus profundilacus]MVZ96784.1 ribonuclease J [Sphingorhabdus profundilacus]